MKMFKRLQFFLHAALVESLAVGLIAFIIVSNNSLPSAQSETAEPSATSSQSEEVSAVWGWWNSNGPEDEVRRVREPAANGIGLFGYVFE